MNISSVFEKLFSQFLSQNRVNILKVQNTFEIQIIHPVAFQ